MLRHQKTAAWGIELSRILAGDSHLPVVYFVKMGDNVKIGTSTSLKARLRSFYLSFDDVLLLLPGGEDVEDACHKRFAAAQVTDDDREELFRLDDSLMFFLGLWRGPSKRAVRAGLPFDLMPRQEVGDPVALDAELKALAVADGTFDEEQAASLIGRLTFLGATAQEHSPWADTGQRCAYYWDITHQQAKAEAAGIRRVLAANPRWWQLWKAGDYQDPRPLERLCAALDARTDRAARIRDLFVMALQGYDDRPLRKIGGRRRSTR
jgi:hypothetical protein